jgi:hypothetical protein
LIFKRNKNGKIFLLINVGGCLEYTAGLHTHIAYVVDTVAAAVAVQQAVASVADSHMEVVPENLNSLHPSVPQPQSLLSFAMVADLEHFGCTHHNFHFADCVTQ